MAYNASEGYLGRDGSRVRQDGGALRGTTGPGTGLLRGTTGADDHSCSSFLLLFVFSNDRSFLDSLVREASRARAREGQPNKTYTNVHNIEKKYT